jgi:HlyD family secretion protein
MKISSISILICALALVACNNKTSEYDASGTFEAVETIVSSEATGAIRMLNIEEGKALNAGDNIGYIDSIQLHLRKKQLQAQVTAMLSKRPDVSAQLAALHEQLKQAETEQQRVIRLVKADAATAKQLDDVNAQVAIIRKQIGAQESALGITVNSLNEETLPLTIQIEQLNDQLAKCRIINPVKGVVLTKYAEVNEMTTTGKPLYKIADLSEIILRAYVTGEQFAAIKTGQHVQVFVDDANGTYRSYPGTIEWISDKAEFTPKTIQTKDERANLVYAVKIRVKNDGLLKIGMYGEVQLK